MAIDKAVDSSVLDGIFSGIADAIREKNRQAAGYAPGEMAQAIREISAGDLVMTTGTLPDSNVRQFGTGLSAWRVIALQASGHVNNCLHNALLYSQDGQTVAYAYIAKSTSTSYATNFDATFREGNTYRDFQTTTFTGGVFDFSAMTNNTLNLAPGLSYSWVAIGTK